MMARFVAGFVQVLALSAPVWAQMPVTLPCGQASRAPAGASQLCATPQDLVDRDAETIAAARLLRERRDYPAALALLTALRPGASRDAELGHVWFEQGDHLRADRHFGRALEDGLDPDRQTRERMVIAAYLQGEARQYSDDNPRAAVAAYRRALALDPVHVPALLGRAEALQKLDQHETALVDLDRAIHHGADWTGFLLRARSRRVLGDEAGAVADFHEVLRANPGHVGAWQALAGPDGVH